MYRGVNCLFSKQCRIACRLRVADSLHGHRAMPCTSTSTWLNCNYDATWHSPLTADSSGNTTQLGFNAGLVNKREPAGGILPIALAQAEQYSVTESESMEEAIQTHQLPAALRALLTPIPHSSPCIPTNPPR